MDEVTLHVVSPHHFIGDPLERIDVIAGMSES